MKKRFFRYLTLIVLLCLLTAQAIPASASDTVRFYTTEMQYAALSDFAFQAGAVDFSASHKYRDQLLTDDQKALYDLFVCSTPSDNVCMMDLETLPPLPAVSDPRFQTELAAYLSELVLPAYAAAVQDTPMLFWTGRIGYSCSYSIRGTELESVTVICSAVPSDGFSGADYDSMCREIQDVLQSVSFETGNRRELLRQFHDYLCETIVYIDSAYAHNIYGALVKGEAVCEGYAKSFKLFCDLYEIPCMLITGNAVTSTGFGPHAWNAVRMEDGNWYAVDVTWDDQDEIYYDFFLIGSQTVPESFLKITFEESHLADGDFYGNGVVKMDFPALSAQTYTHTHVYDEGTVTVTPTCQNEGTIYYACLGCEIGYSETLSKLAHDYAGSRCSMCGAQAPVFGDCTGDSVLNCKDVTRLARYLATRNPLTGVSELAVSEGADCNGDGKINSADLTCLLRYLANIDPATGKSSVELGK